MLTTDEALRAGFQRVENGWVFRFGDHNEYELCFEELIMDGQMYVALYKNQDLIINEKVVVKAGYIKKGVI